MPCTLLDYRDSQCQKVVYIKMNMISPHPSCAFMLDLEMKKCVVFMLVFPFRIH